MVGKKKVEKEAALERVMMMAQIRRMVQFMELEGQDRAAHLEERAEEEFYITKGQLINHQRRSIAVQFEKKLTKLESGTNTAISKMRNQGRLEGFEEKAIIVDEIVKEISERVLNELQRDNELYMLFLENLYMQALCMLMNDGNILVTVRKNDQDIAAEILTTVTQEFKNLTGMTIKAVVDSEEFLEESSMGGGVFTSGRVFVSSTIQERIQDVVIRAMPFIRSNLFGVNSRRKFFY